MTLYRGRCRIVFFARPIDENQPPKSEPDKESEGAGTQDTPCSVRVRWVVRLRVLTSDDDLLELQRG